MRGLQLIDKPKLREDDVGLRPKDSRVCGRHSALALRPHLGLRPKPRASHLARSLILLEMRLRKAGGRHLPSFFDSLRKPGE